MSSKHCTSTAQALHSALEHMETIFSDLEPSPVKADPHQ